MVTSCIKFSQRIFNISRGTRTAELPISPDWPLSKYKIVSWLLSEALVMRHYWTEKEQFHFQNLMAHSITQTLFLILGQVIPAYLPSSQQKRVVQTNHSRSQSCKPTTSWNNSCIRQLLYTPTNFGTWCQSLQIHKIQFWKVAWSLQKKNVWYERSLYLVFVLGDGQVSFWLMLIMAASALRV